MLFAVCMEMKEQQHSVCGLSSINLEENGMFLLVICIHPCDILL